ncbi:hypothetical protein BGZ83_001920 [Gryganskiella cystojenkinii]|nr:hypothetical protein BGZ83_001920 [Gryganskiella cystojenkinii]
MDPVQPRQKQRHGLEPTQRRVRHIQCILARNLTFTQNSNQRTLTSVLQQHQHSGLKHTNNNSSLHYAGSTNSGTNMTHQSSNRYNARSITPSIELPSGASSPTRAGYFRSPWNNYPYSLQKTKGPGSDTGSVSASDSGRGMSASIKEPIVRLSAGLKATVLHKSNTVESGYTSDSGSGTGSALGRKNTTMAVFSPSAKKGFRHSRDLKTPEPNSIDATSLSSSVASSHGTAVPATSPSQMSIQDRLLSPDNNNDSTPRNSTEIQLGDVIPDHKFSQDDEEEISGDLPPFVYNNSNKNTINKPLLLDTYFTLHDSLNDNVIYTSDTVIRSNNPNYNPLEDHLFLDQTKRRSSNVTIRIWAGHNDSDFYPLLEWRVELCCLRFVAKELRDVPVGLPNNTILVRFDNGFYTAPDEEDLTMVHPHTPTTVPAVVSGSGSGSGSGGARRSYTYESATRLNNLHECIADTKKSRDEIKHNIDLALNKENAPLIMQKRKGEFTERLWHLQRQLGHELNILDQAQGKATALRQRLAERHKALAESKERGQTQEMYLEESIVNLTKNKESLFSNLKEYSTKRTELIATLFTIFPITESEGDSDLLMICKVPLPNSVYIGYDEDVVSIALGLTCHLVTMLAHYLCVPLRYPLTPMGSRAFILDPVSLLVGPKEFPLFGKGQDRLRFEYGVFLLNKNIEQLMNSQGLQFMDLRQTLPNIRYLMETLLTTSPVQSMLYRSKFLSRKKQDRLDQEKLNDLFVISHEQHDFDQILHPDEAGLGIDSEGLSTRHHHQRGISTTTTLSSTAPGIVREYDPIDGEYTLVLDSASMRSPASRKTTTNATGTPRDSPASVRREALSVPLSPKAIVHGRSMTALRRAEYASSVATTETEEDEEGEKSPQSETPSYMGGWVGPILQKRDVDEEPISSTASTDGSENRDLDLMKPFDSKISSISRALFDSASQESGSNSGNQSPRIDGIIFSSEPSEQGQSPRATSPTITTMSSVDMTPADSTLETPEGRAAPPPPLPVRQGPGLTENGGGQERTDNGGGFGNNKFDPSEEDIGPQSASHSPPQPIQPTSVVLSKGSTEVQAVERNVEERRRFSGSFQQQELTY